MIAASVAPLSAKADGRQIIRDAEIENDLREFVTPIFQAAGLTPSAVEIILVDDPSINSFVSGGQHIYIHTGLLMRAENAEQVIGVIAHETGHIMGGHIAARISAARDANKTLIVTYLLGLGAALASGRGEVAAATIKSGQDIALKNLLGFTRDQEQRADQSAVTLLNATHQSPQGLLSFMEILSGQEVLLAANQDPYLQTHPLTSQRIDFLRHAVEESPYRNDLPSKAMEEQFARIKAKLIGFLDPLPQVLRTYPKEDSSVPARYARAIAYYRKADLKQALPLVSGLIEQMPDDPYFHELKGQMLFENGRVTESLPDLKTAVKLLPDSPQIMLLLSRALIEVNNPESDREAIEHLKRVVQAEPNNVFAWRLAATAYGRQGDQGMLSLAMAEAALASGHFQEAKVHSKHALEFLPRGSPSWIRADDVLKASEQGAAKEG